MTLEPLPLTPTTAWAAGLFEGEGYICNPDRKRPRPRIMLGLVTTDEDVVRRFQRAVGKGKVGGPFTQQGLGKKPFWRWAVYGPVPVSEILMMLWLGLGERRRAVASAALDLVIAGRMASPLATDTSLLPTPVARDDGKSPEAHRQMKANLAGGPRTNITSLSVLARADFKQPAGPLLPTPTGDDANNVTRESGDFQSLAREANQLMPTPSSRDRKGKSARDPHRSDNGKLRSDQERPLSDIEQLLPTPHTRDYHAQGASRNAGASQTQLSTLIQKYGPDGIPTGAYTQRQSKGGKNSRDPLPGQLTIEDA